MVGVLYDALERLPREQLPPKPILLSWYALTEQISTTNERMDKDCVWISEYFKEAGFRNAILKGQGNAQLYPNPKRRQSGDIDIWLEGGRKEIIDYVLGMFPGQQVLWHEIKFPIKKDTIIEVHPLPSLLFCPADNRRLQILYGECKDATFNNRIPLADGSICVPTWEMNVIFQMTHIYHHFFFEGVGFRQIMDYYYLLNNGDVPPEAKEQAKRTIGSLHLMRFAGALMWVLRDVFLLEEERLLVSPNEAEGVFMLREMMLAGNFGKYDERNKVMITKWERFWNITRRSLRFATRYPRVVAWLPWHRLCQFAWRRWNGYK